MILKTLMNGDFAILQVFLSIQIVKVIFWVKFSTIFTVDLSRRMPVSFIHWGHFEGSNVTEFLEYPI